MGLDMYLSKKTYVKKSFWNHMKPEHRHQISVKKNHKKHPHIDPKKITYIVEEAGYWRKANCIHDWFVNHCQKGNDDCKEYYVERSQLQELLDTCILVRDNSKLIDKNIENSRTIKDLNGKAIMEDKKAIEDPSVAEDLLPSAGGFFFGSTEYDEYYMQDVLNTIKILEYELSIQYENGFYEPEYYYQASW
jgi:hypothetical protein